MTTGSASYGGHTDFSAHSTPSSASGFSPFGEWAADQRRARLLADLRECAAEIAAEQDASGEAFVVVAEGWVAV